MLRHLAPPIEKVRALRQPVLHPVQHGFVLIPRHCTKPALRAARAKGAIPAGLLIDVVDLLQPTYHRRGVSLQSVTGRAQDAVTGRVVSELILAEQAGRDRGAALRARHIGYHSGLLAGLDILDLEVAAVGDHRDAVRAEQRLGRRRGLGQQAHVDDLIGNLLPTSSLCLASTTTWTL